MCSGISRAQFNFWKRVYPNRPIILAVIRFFIKKFFFQKSQFESVNNVLKYRIWLWTKLVRPTLAQQRDFISSHYKILEKNLYHYFARVTHERRMITLQTPDLNRQQKHKSMSLVCKCVKSIFTDSSWLMIQACSLAYVWGLFPKQKNCFGNSILCISSV